MAFRDSINDLMFRFYERFKQNNNRLPVSVDADINVGDVQIGTVKQGGVDEGAEPWKVKAEELEQKIDALKQSIESGVQLKGSDENPVNVQLSGHIVVGTLLANEQRSATVSSADLEIVSTGTMLLNVTVTALQGSPTIKVVLESAGQDNTYAQLGRGFIVSDVGSWTYPIDVPPCPWRVTVVHVNSDPITYSVSYSVMVWEG